MSECVECDFLAHIATMAARHPSYALEHANPHVTNALRGGPGFSRLYRVEEPNERGHVPVAYLSCDLKPTTAFLVPGDDEGTLDVAYWQEGW